MKLPRAPAVTFYSKSNRKNKNRNEENCNGIRNFENETWLYRESLL